MRQALRRRFRATGLAVLSRVILPLAGVFVSVTAGSALFPAARADEAGRSEESGVSNTGKRAKPEGQESDDALRERLLALNDVTGDDPILGQIKLLTDHPKKTKRLLEAGLKLVDQKDQPLNPNATYILGRAALILKDPAAARVFFRVNAIQVTKLRSPQRLTMAYSGLLSVIDLLQLDKKYEQSTKLCQEFLEMMEKEQIPQRVKAEVIRRMVRSLAHEGKMDEAMRLVDTLIKSREKDWRNLELRGFVQRLADNHEAAAKTYEELLDAVAADDSLDGDEKKELQTDVRYMLSGIYVDLNRIDDAAAILKKLVKEYPDEPSYHNDLGYIWADHGMHLEESEKLVRKALDLDKKKRKDGEGENASYLDSLGWVLFKQKKYKEAKTYLLKAVADPKEGQHLEIYDHLGDIQFALGEKTDAAKTWKKAIELGGATKRDQQRKADVEKKIKQTGDVAGSR